MTIKDIVMSDDFLVVLKEYIDIPQDAITIKIELAPFEPLMITVKTMAQPRKDSVNAESKHHPYAGSFGE